MNVYEAISERYSVRGYEDKPIPDDVLRRIMEAVQKAPSASNRQACKFVVVKDEETKTKLAKVSGGQMFIAEASVVIAGIAVEPERLMLCGVNSSIVDVVIAMDHITLAAVEEGLGTCWIGKFSQDDVRQILNIPDSNIVVELMPLGYPRLGRTVKPKKTVEELFSFDKFR